MRLQLLGAGILAAGGLCGGAMGQMVNATLPTPVVDRWMYSFNQSPGLETEARVFSPLFSPFQSSFDNRDGQFLVAWDTGGLVPSGHPQTNYRIIGATVTARISGDKRFRYDATYDAFNTYLPTDPAYVPDADIGRAIEMFACGYRNGFTALTFTQTSPFNPGAPFPIPARGIRNVFPAQYNASNVLVDVSNNVEDRFEARPIGVGHAVWNTDVTTAASIAPGDLMPQNADVVFNVDLTKPEAIASLRGGLAAGRVSVVITSLEITDQQASTVPRFYTRQWVVQNGPDPAAKPAKLVLTVCVGPPADWDCNGSVQVQDIFAFLTGWFGGSGDYNADGANTVSDIFAFLTAWFAG